MKKKANRKIDPQRSATMRAIKSGNTTPEIAVRKLLFAQGYRYRLHRKDLPGRPDIVFVSKKKVIFVNGCFWHGHDCNRGSRQPKQNADYWRNKIGRNRMRDLKNTATLRKMGWRVLVIWECTLKDTTSLVVRLRGFLKK